MTFVKMSPFTFDIFMGAFKLHLQNIKQTQVEASVVPPLGRLATAASAAVAGGRCGLETFQAP